MISFMAASHLDVGSQDAGALSISPVSITKTLMRDLRNCTVFDVPDHSKIAAGSQYPVNLLECVVGSKPCAVSMQRI